METNLSFRSDVCRRLLFCLADYDCYQTVRRNLPVERKLDTGCGNLGGVGSPGIEIVERQPVEADGSDVIEDLPVIVDAQREAAHQIILCRLQLSLARTIAQEIRQRVAHHLESLVGLPAL